MIKPLIFIFLSFFLYGAMASQWPDYFIDEEEFWVLDHPAYLYEDLEDTYYEPYYEYEEEESYLNEEEQYRS